jgi:hypothetical protein
MAIGYFQRGVCEVLVEDFPNAIDDFDMALSVSCVGTLQGNKHEPNPLVRQFQLLKDNDFIDYNQLGLRYQLYASEILFNRALCFVETKDIKSAKADFAACSGMKLKPEQEMNIKSALRTNGQEGDLITIALGTLFRPPSEKINNTTKKEFLAKAKVVASQGARNSYVGFMGARTLGLQSSQMMPTPIKNQDSPQTSPRSKANMMASAASGGRQAPRPGMRTKRSSVSSYATTAYTEAPEPSRGRRPSNPTFRSRRSSANDDTQTVATTAMGFDKVITLFVLRLPLLNTVLLWTSDQGQVQTGGYTHVGGLQKHLL